MITIWSSSTNTSSSCRLNNSFLWTTFKAKWSHKLIRPILLQTLTERSPCNSSQWFSLECFKASNSSSQHNFPQTITITIVECNFLISNNNSHNNNNNTSNSSQISFRFSHRKTCIHINKFNRVNSSFILNPTFLESKQVILARLRNKTSKKQSMSPPKQRTTEEKENWWSKKTILETKRRKKHRKRKCW